MSDLSFRFRFAFYGLLFGLSGRASPFPLGLCDFRGFLDRMAAPKERRRSHPVKVFTRTASRGINHYFFSERAQAGNGRENLCRHIYTNLKWKPLCRGNISRQHFAICEKSKFISRPAALQDSKTFPVSIHNTGFPRFFERRSIAVP